MGCRKAADLAKGPPSADILISIRVSGSDIWPKGHLRLLSLDLKFKEQGGVGLTPQILLMDALEDKTPDEAEEDVGRPGGDERREGAGIPHGDGDGKDYPIDEADD